MDQFSIPSEKDLSSVITGERGKYYTAAHGIVYAEFVVRVVGEAMLRLENLARMVVGHQHRWVRTIRDT